MFDALVFHKEKNHTCRQISFQKFPTFQVLKFDDDGDADQDSVSQKVSEEGKKYEAEDEDFGGINIDKAKSVLKAEDKFDKLLERQRIKARKLEEKRKAKEAKKRKKDQDEVKNYSLSGAPGLI